MYVPIGALLMLVMCGAAVSMALVLMFARIRESPKRGQAPDLTHRDRSIDLVLAGSNEGLWHWNLINDSFELSSKVRELLDYRPHDFGTRIAGFLDAVHPDDRDLARNPLASCLLEQAPYNAEFRLRLKSGAYRWFRARAQVARDDANRVVELVGTLTDVTDRKLAEATIGRHAMQQGLIAELGQFALTNPNIVELMSHATGAVDRGLAAECSRLFIAKAAGNDLVLAGATGWDESWTDRPHYDAVEETEDRFIIGVRESVIIEDFDTEYRFKPSAMLRAHRIRSGVEMLICGASDSFGMLGVYSRETARFNDDSVNFLRSITNILASSLDRKLADERLTYLAQFDALTGLPNRSMFLERLWHAISEAEHDRRHAGVIFVDLDRFKLVNDTLGHSAGDHLLMQVAKRLSSCLRADDIVGRLGGDEFAVALPRLGKPSDAGAISQKVLTAFALPFDLAGQEFYISASLGIGVYPTDGRDPDTLLKSADTAMYRAKQAGRNTFEFYVPQMKDRAIERLRMETELRGALDRGEFLIHYQPKAHIASGAISGFEALIRWQHPERGLILPGEFITVLEETGMIIPVGAWVVNTVCRQLRAWKMAGLPLHPVAINLSPRQFAHAELDKLIGATLQTTGIDPRLLEFELTESMLMVDSKAAVTILNNLRAFGIRLSVDDFGTGYSSLAYLRRFPLDALKIDRAFIRDVDSDPDGALIVLAIINLAHSLELKVVAEGVETDSQLSFLRAHGCDEMQGYYFARPQPVEHCTRALMEGWNLDALTAVHWLARQA